MDILVDAEFSHLAIVGKEPLVSLDAARRCRELIGKCASRGKTVSLITNGLGLRYLDPGILGSLAWIDVSCDGGPQTYSSYRGASYNRLKRGLEWVESHGYRRVNALHTLTDVNLCHIDDMVSLEREFPFDRIVFSPYIVTRNHGSNPVSAVSLQNLCSALSASSTFMSSSKSLLLIGIHSFKTSDDQSVRDEVVRAGLLSKAALIADDPLELGILRVTYDGLVLTPTESLHTLDYSQIGRPLAGAHQLNQLYHDLCLTHAA